jgi:hypothetical protein
MARITMRSTLLFPAVLAVAIGLAGAAQAADCLTYGGQATLDGWLSLKPATAEQIAGGMEKGSHWSMKLAKPICVAADATDPAVNSLTRVALRVPADHDKDFRAAFNKRVAVSGTIRATSAAKAGYAVVLDGAALPK